jgi:hypothetical protein
MFLLFAAAAVAIVSKPVASATAQATATIRIERPAIASDKEWNQPAKASRREVVRRDERGRPMLLRVIEYQ